MKFLGLDGKEHTTTLVIKKRGKVSKHHERARTLLKELYPLDQVFEEVTLPGSKTAKNGTLYADFYIHSRSLMVEVQGTQHDEFNSFFHANKLEYHKGKARDKAKREWCELNDITLIELPCGETDEQWRDRINS
jgi:hypothetical protein